jgi:membrane associated rhomboid family serine protease
MTRAPDGSFVFQNLEPKHRPKATWALTFTIVVASVLGEEFPALKEQFDILPSAVRAGEWWRLVTGALLHGGYLHLAANAYFGWSIGARVERYIGAWRLLVITAVAMLASGLAVTFFSEIPAVGFSGVLYGWLASWLAFHLTPRFPGLRLSGPQRSAYLQLLGANLLLSLLPGISLLAHAGGFVAGFAAAYVLGQKR